MVGAAIVVEVEVLMDWVVEDADVDVLETVVEVDMKELDEVLDR